MKRSSRRRNAYARRVRDWSFMAWVKTQPCAARHLGPCEGPIEADHMGDIGAKGIGMRAGDDRTCVPMCTKHHRERTDHCGAFEGWTREQQFAFRAECITRTQTLYVYRLGALDAAKF